MTQKTLSQQANEMLIASLEDVDEHTNRLTVYARKNGQAVAIGFAIRVGGQWMLSTEVRKQKQQDPELVLAFGLNF